MTVALADLTGTTIVVSNVSFGVDYLIEQHLAFDGTAMTVSWYANSALQGTESPNSHIPGPNITFGFGELHRASATPDTAAVYTISDLSIGSSRGAANLWSDSLATVPTHPPYQSVSDPSGSFSAGLQVVDDPGGLAILALSSIPSDVWVTYTINFANANVVNFFAFAGPGDAGGSFPTTIGGAGSGQLTAFTVSSSGLHVWQRF